MLVETSELPIGQLELVARELLDLIQPAGDLRLLVRREWRRCPEQLRRGNLDKGHPGLTWPAIGTMCLSEAVLPVAA